MPARERRTLTATERLAWLRLIRTPHVGPISFFHLLSRCGSAEAALEALPDLASRGGRRNPLRVPAQATAEAEIEAVERVGARLVAWGEPDYPQPLAAIADPPFPPGWTRAASRPGAIPRWWKTI